jgi:hypothetical protein
MGGEVRVTSAHGKAPSRQPPRRITCLNRQYLWGGALGPHRPPTESPPSLGSTSPPHTKQEVDPSFFHPISFVHLISHSHLNPATSCLVFTVSSSHSSRDCSDRRDLLYLIDNISSSEGALFGHSSVFRPTIVALGCSRPLNLSPSVPSTSS